MADYKHHHHHTKLTYFRALLDELLYYQKIHLAAEERQKHRRPGRSSGEKLLAHKSKKENGDFTFPQKSTTQHVSRRHSVEACPQS